MINALTQPRRISVNKLISDLNSEVLFVDDSYQRRLVWTEKQRIRLVETVLMGYPMPEVYLWNQPPDPDSGDQTQSIVDGQQRLRTLQSFTLDDFKLKKSLLDAENQDSGYAGKLWSELSPELRQTFWEYEINVRTLPSATTEREIRRIFARLNETDKSLNPQELRHAKLQGSFLQASEDVADLPFWRQVKFFSDNSMRRMKDVEFSSSLLTFLRNGIVSDTAASLNDVYDLFSDQYSKRRADYNKTNQLLKDIKSVYNTGGAAVGYITKETHLYTLFVVAFTLREQGKRLRADTVNRFFAAYDAYDEDRVFNEGTVAARRQELLRRYNRGSSSRIGSKTSREQRVFSMLDYLDSI
jgi:uncharacterized protein with ParB-like and HNH nuclease domain